MKPLLICLLALICMPLYAQIPTDSLLAKADYYYEEEEQYKPALELYEKAWAQARRQRQFPQAASALEGISYVIGDSISNHKALERLETELPRMFRRDETPDTVWYKILLTRAYFYYQTDNYSQALADLEEAISIYEGLNWKADNAAYAYRIAAYIYMRYIDYDKAISSLKKALKLDPNREVSLRSSLADCYIYLEDYDEAWKQCQMALKSPKLQDDARRRALLHNTMSSIMEVRGDLAGAEQYVKQALQFYTGNEEPEEAAKCYLQLGNLAEKRSQYAQAETYLEKAIASVKTANPAKNRETAKILCQVGDYYAGRNSLPLALEYYQQAIIQVFPGFNSLDIKDNPPLDQTPLESWAMTAPARKAEALLSLYKKNSKLADLRNAAHCFDLAIAGHHHLIETYGSDEARLYLSDYNFNKYENAIETQFLLWQQTRDKSCLARIFELMEESKSAVLRDAVSRRRALILADIPEKVRTNEASLRLEMAQLTESRLQTAMLENAGDHKLIDSLDERLGDLRRDYDRLLAKHSDIWRNFYQTKAQTTLSDVQSFLSGDDLFLEYCWGERQVYLLAVQKNGVRLYRFPNEPQIREGITRFISYFASSDRINADPRAYFRAALACFNLVFPEDLRTDFPWLANGKPGRQLPKLYLAPDGILNTVPFEALLTKAYQGDTYADAPYLLKNARVLYGWSADLLWAGNAGKRSGSWIQFSPGFAGRERGLAPLPFSLDETGRSGFKKLLNHNATADKFNDLAADAYLLHLSTHAESGGEAAEPQIAFFDKSLSLSQLYAMDLGANLAVLSACETHIGAIARGEGAMSLARGFAYAGVQSIIASLWPVNERSTALIFAQFYQHISQKKSKATALREAKLDYLQMNELPNARRSPFYWAGFVYIGRDGDLTPPATMLNRFLMALALCAPAITGFWYWRRRARAVTLMLLLIGTGVTAFGAEDTALSRAAEAYRSANYEEAIRLYESQLKLMPDNADLHYNLGNAYFKAGRIGGAVLHYEKAALLAPSDQAIQHNLQIARNKVTDNVAPLTPFFLSRWWNGLGALLSPDVWSVLGLCLLWASATGWIVFWWAAASRRRRIGMWIGIVGLLSAILPFALAASRAAKLKHSGYAVVMSEGARLHSAPEAQQTLEPLNEGYKVELLDAIGDWRKVQLPNGDEGWVEARVLTEI
jgi:tetratricopeptide (TPR) repeat protein